MDNSKEKELQHMQFKDMKLHQRYMEVFRELVLHLKSLYPISGYLVIYGLFNDSFCKFFGEEHQNFGKKMFHNLDELQSQCERENVHEANAKTCLEALRTQFKILFASKTVTSSDYLNRLRQEDFKDYTVCDLETFRSNLLNLLDMLAKYIDIRVIKYGELRMKKGEVQAIKETKEPLNEEIPHEHEIGKSFKLKSKGRSNLLKHLDILSEEEKVDMREAIDAELVVTESSGTKPVKQDTSSSSGNYTTQAADADIGLVNDEVSFTKVQLTDNQIILANVQQHTVQSEPSYDTHLLETIDSNTTSTSTNMCHRGGEIVQDAEQVKSPLLDAEFFKSKEMIENEVYNELSKRFLQLEKHCISLEIQNQQKEESFQSNKPCENQEFPEFREFFVINDLKAQLQAKTTLICDLKIQIKSVKDASNEVKVKNDFDVIETINIELEHSVAKLLAANEQLLKENEHLKQTYKELFDSIKMTQVQNKDNSESLIYQINQKSVENADLKAQFQEKVFANTALKNELRKLNGKIVDSKFAKASILGKPPLQPSRNHLVARQPNAFKSERPRILRSRFAS
ncbi:hypothetical protein Tco_0811852 [Tanacetum coccineum]